MTTTNMADEYDLSIDPAAFDAAYMAIWGTTASNVKSALAAVPQGDPTAAAQGQPQQAPPQQGQPVDPAQAMQQQAAQQPQGQPAGQPTANPAAMSAMADQAQGLPPQAPLTAEDVKGIVSQALSDHTAQQQQQAQKPSGGSGGAGKGAGKGGMDPTTMQAMAVDIHHAKTYLQHLFRHIGLEEPPLHNPYRDPNTGLPIDPTAQQQQGQAPAPVKQAESLPASAQVEYGEVVGGTNKQSHVTGATQEDLASVIAALIG